MYTIIIKKLQKQSLAANDFAPLVVASSTVVVTSVAVGLVAIEVAIELLVRHLVGELALRLVVAAAVSDGVGSIHVGHVQRILVRAQLFC